MTTDSEENNRSNTYDDDDDAIKGTLKRGFGTEFLLNLATNIV